MKETWLKWTRRSPNLYFLWMKSGAEDTFKGITKKNPIHLAMDFCPSERSKYVQDFYSLAATGENNNYQSLTRSFVPTTYSIWLFSHIIFDSITFTNKIFTRKELFPPHFMGEEASSEKLIYQSHLACTWERQDSNLGLWVSMHTPTHKSIKHKNEKQYSHITKGFLYRIPFCHPLWVRASVLSTGNEKTGLRLTESWTKGQAPSVLNLKHTFHLPRNLMR